MQQPLSPPPSADQDAYTAFWHCVEDTDSRAADVDVPIEAGPPSDAYEQFLASADAD